MFFFSLGASFDLPMLPDVLLPGIILATLLLVSKPLALRANDNNSLGPGSIRPQPTAHPEKDIRTD